MSDTKTKANPNAPTRTPPQMDYSFQITRLRIGVPADNLTQEELFKWVAHLRSIQLKLSELQQHLIKRESDFNKTKFKWATVLRGLKRTVLWQASVLEQKGYPEIQKKLKALLRWVPEFENKDVQKDRKAVGAEERYPFFTEAYLYNTIGKEDARTLLSAIRNLCESVGLNPDDLQGEEEPDPWFFDELEREFRERD